MARRPYAIDMRESFDAAWDAGERFLATLPHDYVTLSCPACGEPQWSGQAGDDTEFASDSSPRMIPGDPPRMKCADCGATGTPTVEPG